MEHIVKDVFFQNFGIRPNFIVRAPGRVNIIGEHIDYNGYGVLPMALEQSIFCAVAPTSHSATLHFKNFDAANFRDAEVAVNDFSWVNEKTSDVQAPEWFRYFMCGYRGIVEFLSQTRPGTFELVGMKVLVAGTIPPSSGLSSSSALVCAAALCTLKVLTGRDFDLMSRTDLADLCAKCEKYIGTEGGGMDQAICFLAERGKAKLINFNPLATANVQIPAGGVFIVSNSCVEANKAASHYFNERVVETRYASKLMAYKCGLSNWASIQNLSGLQRELGTKNTLPEMLTLVEKLLVKQCYSYDDLLSLFDGNVTKETMKIEIFDKLHVRSNEIQLKLRQRALHVYSEAGRVEEFSKICINACEEASLFSLGQLMDQSHVSCRDLYDCSCAELDELQLLAKKFGAYGSRLTGAGWGGCLVSLVPLDKRESFVENLRSSFYANFSTEKFNLSVFATEPSQGAELTVLSDGF